MPFAFASGSLLSFSLGHPQWWSCRGGGALGRGTSMTVRHTVGVSIPSNWLTSCTTREDRKHFHKTCFPTHFVSKSCQNQSYSIIFFRSWYFGLWTLPTPRLGAIALQTWQWSLACIYSYISYIHLAATLIFLPHFTRNKLLPCFSSWLYYQRRQLHCMGSFSSRAMPGWEWRFFVPMPLPAGELPLAGKREDLYFPAGVGVLGRCHLLQAPSIPNLW